LGIGLGELGAGRVLRQGIIGPLYQGFEAVSWGAFGLLFLGCDWVIARG